MPKITPWLWFDTEAEEAARFYVGLFEDSRIVSVVPYGPDTPGPEGSVMIVEFELMGQRYVGINGGPQFPFTEAVSLEVRCEDQPEIDRIWAALVEGGEPGPCGWLKDRYGLSWQVSSTDLETMLTDPDQEKVDRVTQAFLKVDGEPFDIAALGQRSRATPSPRRRRASQRRGAPGPDGSRTAWTARSWCASRRWRPPGSWRAGPRARPGRRPAP